LPPGTAGLDASQKYPKCRFIPLLGPAEPCVIRDLAGSIYERPLSGAPASQEFESVTIVQPMWRGRILALNRVAKRKCFSSLLPYSSLTIEKVLFLLDKKAAIFYFWNFAV
jgi:hypothetical protein